MHAIVRVCFKTTIRIFWGQGLVFMVKTSWQL